MAIKQSAYETSALAGFVTAKTKEALEAAFIKGQIKTYEDTNLVLVERSPLNDLSIPDFSHPMVFTESGETYVAADVRPFGRYEPIQEHFVIQNPHDFKTMRVRGILEDAWVSNKPERLRAVAGIPLGVFASMVSEELSNRAALPPQDQYSVQILAGIWFAYQFWDKKHLDKMDQDLITTIVSKNTNLNPQDVARMVEQFQDISDIEDFCRACQEVSTSTRMRNVVPATLMGVVSSYWFGANRAELMAVALEHPPTWMSLIYQAYNEAGYRKTRLADMLEKRSRFKKAKDQFVRQLVTYVEV